MELTFKYKAEDSLYTISREEYVARFRDVERISSYCKACPNYGKTWGCPPFEYDVEAMLNQYKYVLLIATKITPFDEAFPFNQVSKLILPERSRLEQHLLKLEAKYGGRAFSYIGTCLHCPSGTCTRPKGLPCRHPDKVRPSLEACGFDVSKTTEELFHLPLKWGKNGLAPEYLQLVCAFFHNQDNVQWDE